MDMEREVWAIQHVGYEDLGSFEGILKARGFHVRYMRSRAMPYADMYAGDPDLLVILGGPMSVYDTENHPWIANEVAFAAERIESGRPLLGICLGAQAIAKALGADVYAGPQGKEIGWSRIAVNAAGMETPLRHLDGAQTMMMHWHGDTFDMPDGAVLLASSEKYKKQAFAYGDHVLAMQCHAEVTEAKLRLWYGSNLNEIAEVGTSVDALKADAAAHGDILTRQAALFFNEWLDLQGFEK